MPNMITKFTKIMMDAKLDDTPIRAFLQYYKLLSKGATGKVSENDITPPDQKQIKDYRTLTIPSYLPYKKLAVIKLNGGLGTSMGLKKVKSLLPAKNGLTFLDIIVAQILHLRAEKKENIPLLLMDSFNTRKDTLDFLKKYPSIKLANIPLDFIQNKFPKIKQSDLSPLKLDDDNMNWNPPGHGEIYMVMQITGILDKLLDNGIEYAFISNSDNLGAVVNEKIFGYFANNDIPFLMEVCERTEMDNKGGHIAQTKDGQLILREIAQCPEDEIHLFQDINLYKYFNTNNLWVNLKYLKKELQNYNNLLPLSLIINPKEIEGNKVYQIESAMGSAISVFEGSKAIAVPRNRLVPVKKTNDLLLVWSDAYKLRKDYQIMLENDSGIRPEINLDDRFYKTIDKLNSHCKKGIPSLKKCTSLIVEEDVRFGNNVKIIGDVRISHKMKLENITLENESI
ncbi:MAG: UTP--glucose-1-phosphate uridylyltransferase [Candidatus Cloacimonadota bacterium]|nr:UTP--glucose-1-phosphate uridylyltransferase [Candidatus Cloacimonadota bacterium]